VLRDILVGMTRLLRSSLLLVAACGFSPATSQATDDATQATEDAPANLAIDAAVAIDAKQFNDASTTTPPATPKNCAEAHAGGMTSDGTVMIDPDGMGGAPPYQVYCDQTTAGGGWTLVWVYSFTSYGSFTNGANAVTPRPTWGGPTGAGTTPTSTTTPTSPTTTGALDFAKWASLGDEVMATSDVNHWVKCQPAGGSIVAKIDGTLTCQMVKTVSNLCLTSVPGYWGLDQPTGAGFFGSSNPYTAYYFYDGSTSTIGGNWPTHDPCGSNSANQVSNAQNPRGQLWIRHR
jgi:hypothetical protein